MRSRFIAPWLGFALLAAIVAGCNSSNTTPVNYAQCVLPTGTVVALVYPPPNATGVPDNLSQVVIAANPPLPASWDVVLTFPSGSVFGGAPVVPAPSPLPTPTSSPSFANPTYQTSVLNLPSAIAPKTPVIVSLNDTASNCYPYYPLSTFTTQ